MVMNGDVYEECRNMACDDVTCTQHATCFVGFDATSQLTTHECLCDHAFIMTQAQRWQIALISHPTKKGPNPEALKSRRF